MPPLNHPSIPPERPSGPAAAAAIAAGPLTKLPTTVPYPVCPAAVHWGARAPPHFCPALSFLGSVMSTANFLLWESTPACHLFLPSHESAWMEFNLDGWDGNGKQGEGEATEKWREPVTGRFRLAFLPESRAGQAFLIHPLVVCCPSTFVYIIITCAALRASGDGREGRLKASGGRACLPTYTADTRVEILTFFLFYSLVPSDFQTQPTS